MTKNWFKQLFSSQPKQTPFPRMLKEAKEKGFQFRLISGKRGQEIDRPFSSDDVDIQDEQIVLSADEKTFTVKYRDLREVQVLSKSKIAYLIGTKPVSIIFLGMGVPALGFIVYFFSDNINRWLGMSVDFIEGIGIGIGIIGYFLYFYVLIAYSNEQEKMRVQALSTGRITTIIKQLTKANKEEEYFSALLLDNLKNIQDFNSLVKQQTHNSYRVTVYAAIAGFVVLLVGIFLPAKVSNANLTIASGLIIEFISAVFFVLHNGKITQLNKYHGELIDVQNTMLALKISHEIADDQGMKNKSMEYLIKKLASNLDKKTARNDSSSALSSNKNQDTEENNEAEKNSG